jgi:hypothetical protein
MSFCFRFFQPTITAAPPKPSVTILVFKTSIRSILDIKAVEDTLAHLEGIMRWNVDSHDIDNVLRIVTTRPDPAQVIEKMCEVGFYCEELPD